MLGNSPGLMNTAGRGAGCSGSLSLSSTDACCGASEGASPPGRGWAAPFGFGGSGLALAWNGSSSRPCVTAIYSSTSIVLVHRGVAAAVAAALGGFTTGGLEGGASALPKDRLTSPSKRPSSIYL